MILMDKNKEIINYPFTYNNIDKSKSYNSIYVGFDPSTKMIGWSIVSDNGELLYMESIALKDISKDNEESLLEKFFAIEEKFLWRFWNIIEKIHYEKMFVSIEHFSYFYQATTQKTVVALSSINYFLQYLIRKKLEKVPTTVYATSARKIVGIIVDKKLKEDSKEKVYEYVTSRYGIQLDMTKTKRKSDGVYDACDSVIVALSQISS